MKQELVFSGVQPTGNLHLGNYLGAIKNWVDIQNKYRSIFCIVDLHAITVPQDPKELYNNTLELAAIFIACGINPKKSIIFPQSAVSGHSELAWILGCNTPLGWLNRMTQFKEKAGEHKDNSPLGLYSYPVLMAADILLYKATHVPVGDDQKQHLELAREIANSFNHTYKKKLFPQPEPIIQGTATRIMSLNDGTRKMSKSEESDYSRINLSDDADTIRKKFQKAKSDSFPEITYDKEARPDIANLLTIYAALANITVEKSTAHFVGKRSSDLKKELAELAVEKLAPVTSEFNKLKQDKAFLIKTLREGSDKANEIAEKNLKEVKETVGFFV
jgi:tryptophanyl-tRNA synthetase